MSTTVLSIGYSSLQKKERNGTRDSCSPNATTLDTLPGTFHISCSDSFRFLGSIFAGIHLPAFFVVAVCAECHTVIPLWWRMTAERLVFICPILWQVNYVMQIFCGSRPIFPCGLFTRTSVGRTMCLVNLARRNAIVSD